jgi:hypothetical protein
MITATTNVNWPEFAAGLPPGATAITAPAITTRIFKARLERLLHFLKTNMGGLTYIVRVVEFQKRGLPHAHIVVKVSPRKHLF